MRIEFKCRSHFASLLILPLLSLPVLHAEDQANEGLQNLTEEVDTRNGGRALCLYYGSHREFRRGDENLSDHTDFVHKIEKEATIVLGGQSFAEDEEEATVSGVIVIQANYFKKHGAL